MKSNNYIKIKYSNKFSDAKCVRSSKKQSCVIFIHGFSETSDCWNAIVKKLKNYSNFITYDCIGHGNNSHLWREVSVSAYVEQARTIIKFIKNNKMFNSATVVGHSQGAYIAAKLALEEPNTINGLMLVSPFFNMKPATKEIWTNFLKLVQAKDIERFWDLNSSLLLGPKSGVWQNNRLKEISRRLKVFNNKQVEKLIEVLLDININSDIRVLAEKPICLIHGEYDVMFPKYYSEDILRLIPKAKYSVIKGANHLLVEMQDEITEELQELLIAVGLDKTMGIN